ncbi:hypothetical protein ACXU4B_03270 [Dyella soli]|uniref:Outer membrane protein beta-barrel domain-containing protein n=1 Tax=Dyella soli TaxID=522319 RepID=A0A4R0YMF6_9GAMM|nr:hypothetical protein [Dyella soli]TCI10069.1 hypothetical protein EZM97_14150 [Dyella soli]
MYAKRIALSLSLWALLATMAPAMADDHPMLDYASVSAGIFTNDLSASLRFDGRVRNSGTPLDFSRDLGQGGTQSLPFIEGTWRPWERHEFELTYFHDSNDASHTINRTVVFNNQTLNAGATLNSKFSLDAGGVTYRYWAWIGDRAAFGLTAGLQAYSFELKLKATASVQGANGGGSVTRSINSKASTDLPDPSIGLAYRYQMADWARLVADGGAFKANIGNIDATLYNARVGVEFYPWQQIGVVTQYSYNKIDADVTKNRFSGNATFRFSGLQLLFKWRF